MRLEHDTFESASREDQLVDFLPEGTGEYAPATHDRLFNHRRALGPSGGGADRGMACGSYPGNPRSLGVSLSVVDGLADQKIMRGQRDPFLRKTKEAGTAIFVCIRLLSLLPNRGENSIPFQNAKGFLIKKESKKEVLKKLP
jgi:hypothetical protein